mmetsp:Transcript_18182/g.42520  ORF Transcript_18182/g.42520 Transcript_18182/m.42520 type:complete len:618 (+) Transcript_18182:187-2040(+)
MMQMTSSNSEGLTSLSVLIPADRIGKVIGKQGAGLKGIRERTGAKVQVPSLIDESAQVRRVDLGGAPASITQGFVMVLERAYDQDECQACAVMIPAEKAGVVVGKGGDNLKRIRQACNVKVEMEREMHMNPETQTQERYVALTGDLAHMAQAMQMLTLSGSRAAVAAAPAFMSPGGMMPMNAAVLMAQQMAANGGAATLSNVQPASSDPEEVQLQMVIPNDKLAGALIGKGGAQVQSTAQTAGCKVIASDRNMGQRRIVMVGNFSQCMTAQDMVYSQLIEASAAAGEEVSEVSVIFLVRKEAAGAVIGKQGTTLTQIRTQCGCNIQFDKNEVVGHRKCQITGQYQVVQQAERLIFDLVRQVAVASESTSAMPTTTVIAPEFVTQGFGVKRELDGVIDMDGAKRQRLDVGAADPTMTKLLVPANVAGAVIGKQGAGLKTLRENYAVQIEMLKSEQMPQFPEDRVIMLRGLAQARCDCMEGVLRSAFPDGQCQMKLLVPSNKAGVVIGKQGANLKTLRESYGVNVQVDRTEILGERLVGAAGPVPQVVAGITAVIMLLDADQSQSQAGVATAGMEMAGMAALPEGYTAEQLAAAQQQQLYAQQLLQQQPMMAGMATGML